MNATTSSTPRDGSTIAPVDATNTRIRYEVQSHTRALVVGGGGAAGNAWALGIVAGLLAAGIDVTQAELTVGTSSGSTVAAQITSGSSPTALYNAIVDEVQPSRAGNSGQDGGRAPTVSGSSYLEWSNRIIASARDAADMRRTLGAAALERESSGEAGWMRWRNVVAARLPNPRWPEQRVLITAVDARTGVPVVFDRHSGIDLVDAVAASTSAMTPYHIGDERYLNGGYRRNENADLAIGYEQVLVLSPFGGRTRHPREWGMDLETQVQELRASGSNVETVFPDARAGDVFDANALDPSTRPQAARGGYEQGRELARSLAGPWQ